MLAGVLLWSIYLQDDENAVNSFRIHESTGKCDIRELLSGYQSSKQGYFSGCMMVTVHPSAHYLTIPDETRL